MCKKKWSTPSVILPTATANTCKTYVNPNDISDSTGHQAGPS